MANALASPTDGPAHAGAGAAGLRAASGPANASPRQRIPSSEELRRTALARSVRRGTRVARWRVALRWSLWGLGQALAALGLLTLLALLAALLGLGWWQWDATRGPALRLPDQASQARPAKPGRVLPSAAAAEPPRPVPSITTEPALPLRLDETGAIQDRPPAPARGAAAQSPNTHTASPAP